MNREAPQAKVGIAGPRYNDEVLSLSRALRARGAFVRVLDFTGLPAVHRLEILDDRVLFNGRDLDELDIIYVRKLREPADDKALTEASNDVTRWSRAMDHWLEHRARERELGSLIESALSLVSAPLVNDLEAQLVHPRKVHHLRVLSAAGVRVPPFIASNDPEHIAEFIAAQPCGVVLKPLRGFLKTRLLESSTRLPVHERPVLLQQYIEGATVRVYAVGGEAIAAGEMLNAGQVDTSVEPRGLKVVELSEDECRLVARATRLADMPFSGVDLQRPRSGGPSAVLECNAAPMFANFSRLTGFDVPGALAGYLIDRAHGAPKWRTDP